MYLALFSTFLELLLPSGHMQSLLRLVTGMLLLLVLLQPVQQLREKGTEISFPQTAQTKWEERGAREAILEQSSFKKMYGKRLEEQVRQLVLRKTALEDCRVRAELDSEATSGAVRRLEIVLHGEKAGEKRRQVAELVAGEYGISRDKLEISCE